MLPLIESGHRIPPRPAVLALADGTIFRGVAIGAEGHSSATIVFHTAMTGHQEILTDPAYAGQIVAFTYPHVGNTGVNPTDAVSEQAQVGGVVMRDCPATMSNFRATQSLPDYLVQQGIVAISGIDTRQLTRRLRDHGAQGACILAGDDADEAVQRAREVDASKMENQAWADPVAAPRQWTQGRQDLTGRPCPAADPSYRVAVVDLGVRHSFLRELVHYGCEVKTVSVGTTAADVLAMQPDGVVLSSGPGDPDALPDMLATCRDLMTARVPLFGIGLGQQLLARALGATNVRLKYGRHGINHPVREVATGRVFITSQNYALTMREDSLPEHARITHVSLFDGAIQGFELTNAPVMGFLGYPEGQPGPQDAQCVIRRFIELMAASR